jgi:hypothetical protein
MTKEGEQEMSEVEPKSVMGQDPKHKVDSWIDYGLRLLETIRDMAHRTDEMNPLVLRELVKNLTKILDHTVELVVESSLNTSQQPKEEFFYPKI